MDDEKVLHLVVNMQEEQAKVINKLTRMVNSLCVNTVTNMRFELTDIMMECIERGYVTSKEYERVHDKMENYLILNGNHGVYELYTERFKKLPIKNV